MKLAVNERDPVADDKLRLGVICTAILGSTYLAFSLCAAFVADVLATPIHLGSPITWAFITGLGVIALGFVLTCTYAWITNQLDQKVEKAGERIVAAKSATEERK